MNKLTLDDGNIKWDILIDKIKFIIGSDDSRFYELSKKLNLYFNPVKSEYREENSILNKLDLNEKPINKKSTFYIEVNENFSINEEIKLGTKTLLAKYFECKLKQIDYFDTINSIEILFESLAEELSDETVIKSKFSSMSEKQLIKLLKPYYCDEMQKDEYDLTQDQLIEFQLKLIEFIRENSEFEKYIIFVNSTHWNLNSIEAIAQFDNTFLLLKTGSFNETMSIKNMLLFEDEILDCADEDRLYSLAGETNGNLKTFEEVKDMIRQFLGYRYTKTTCNLIKELTNFSK